MEIHKIPVLRYIRQLFPWYEKFPNGKTYRLTHKSKYIRKSDTLFFLTFINDTSSITMIYIKTSAIFV